MPSKITANRSLLSADDLIKIWMAFGAGAQEQFRKLMDASLKAAGS